jgi:hypothetical protein
MKIKPYYILLKWNKSYSQNKSKPSYQIWKEYDDTIKFDSPLYSIIEYFDSLNEAKNKLKLLLN